MNYTISDDSASFKMRNAFLKFIAIDAEHRRHGDEDIEGKSETKSKNGQNTIKGEIGTV